MFCGLEATVEAATEAEAMGAVDEARLGGRLMVTETELGELVEDDEDDEDEVVMLATTATFEVTAEATLKLI